MIPKEAIYKMTHKSQDIYELDNKFYLKIYKRNAENKMVPALDYAGETLYEVIDKIDFAFSQDFGD